MADNFIPIGNLAIGWQNRADPSKIEKGAALEMRNCQITDRDGIAPRAGTELFGASDTSGTPCISSGSFRKRDGSEIPLRSSGTILEIYNDTAGVAAWMTLKTGFTSAKDFDFKEHNINTDLIDYVYFCNAVDPYQRWQGYISRITSALVGGETTIPVVTTLQPAVLFTGTASASTDTTITIAASSWAANLWNNFYVRITAGAHNGKISLISATTATQITFGAIAGLAGTVTTFEIRKLAVPVSGTLIYGGTNIAYTAVPTDSSFTVGSANATAINTGIALAPTETLLNGTPRGNRLKTQHTRMFVANVISNEQALYHSKINDANVFSFSSPRLATDGGIIDTPEGGGGIKDIVIQEDVIYILKNGIVKTLTFTQDGNDLPQIQTLIESTDVSVAGRSFKVGNDVYFATNQNAITSIGRLPNVDQLPQSFDAGYDVKRGIEFMDFGASRGATFKDKAVIACKETNDSTSNDIAIVYNFKRQRWEGIWDIDIADFFYYGNELYFASSATKETYKMFTEGFDKNKAGTHFPVNAFWKSGYLNYTGDNKGLQEFDTVCVTGWIASNTTMTFDLTYDFGSSGETYSWEFSGVETQYIFGEPIYNVLGTFPLGVVPLGATLTEITDNKRKFLVYFRVPRKPCHWFQLGFGSNGIGQEWEVIDISVNVEAIPDTDMNLSKNTET